MSYNQSAPIDFFFRQKHLMLILRVIREKKFLYQILFDITVYLSQK
jgi:hypothetical protein